MKNQLRAFALAAVCAFTSTQALATVIYDTSVHHSSQVGTAATLLATNLGGVGTATFSGSSSGAWTTMAGTLGAGDVLLLGQGSRADLADAASKTAIKSFVESGGTLLQLWGWNMQVFSEVVGATITSNWTTSTGTTFAKTAAAAGTSFATTAASLTSASDHGGISLAALGGGTSIYEGGGYSHVTMYNVGSGSAGFLSWDWCCAASTSTRADWDDALFAAATYTSSVPEPETIALLGLGLLGLGLRKRKSL